MFECACLQDRDQQTKDETLKYVKLMVVFKNIIGHTSTIMLQQVMKEDDIELLVRQRSIDLCSSLIIVGSQDEVVVDFLLQNTMLIGIKCCVDGTAIKFEHTVVKGDCSVMNTFVSLLL